jgi:hypothetical protein
MTTHELKVVPPYMDALLDRSKTFEVRRNDRGYQRGDTVVLREWHPAHFADQGCHRCRNLGWNGHFTDDLHGDVPRDSRTLTRTITFVYSGDPRIGGVEPGFVVLALEEPS